MQRRHTLLAATTVLSGLSGCIAPFTSSGSLREVNVELRNTDDGAWTFHLALETEAGMLDWDSHHVAGQLRDALRTALDGARRRLPAALRSNGWEQLRALTAALGN